MHLPSFSIVRKLGHAEDMYSNGKPVEPMKRFICKLLRKYSISM